MSLTPEEIIKLESRMIETTDEVEAGAIASVLAPYFDENKQEEKPKKIKAFDEPEKYPVLSKGERKKPVVLEGKDGEVIFELDHRICGVESKAVEVNLLTQAMLTDGRDNTSTNAARLQPIVAIMDSIDPMGAIEGMLATQMITMHNLSMECARRASLPKQSIEGRDMNLRHATKLINSFSRAVSALDKHRGKGQQKITVEHQHVQIESGGQAIIGDVHHGGGSSEKRE